MRDIVIIFFLCLMSALCGAALAYLYQELRVSDLKDEALVLRDENEALVADKQRAINERDAWQRRATAQRQEIYVDDKEAADWGGAPVPKRLSNRVRDAARSTDSAAASLGGSGVPARSEDSD